MAEINSQEQEQQMKKLKRLLEGWRMALLPLKSVFLWEQQWHPCAIVGSVSFIYTLIWLLDLNSLTTFALVGLMFNLIDFIVPIICNSIYGPSSWNGTKEKTFEEICRSIVMCYNKTLLHGQSFYAMRVTSPCMYYAISISMMCALAWISSTVNNIFLLYVVSVTILLWPGIQHRGIVNTILAMVNRGPKSMKAE